MAAPEAIQNGVSTTAEMKARASSDPGSWVAAIAANAATPARSDTIMTRRRSNRSPMAPASGATNPFTPNVRNSVADSHVGDPVSSYTVNISAVYAAAPPVMEIRRATARRRTAVFGGVRWAVMKRLLTSGRPGTVVRARLAASVRVRA